MTMYFNSPIIDPWRFLQYDLGEGPVPFDETERACKKMCPGDKGYDPNKAPKPPTTTAPKPPATTTPKPPTSSGSGSSTDKELLKQMNAYRTSRGLPAVKHDEAMYKVAKAHVDDLRANPPSGNCFLHSWSSKGKWSGCCYPQNGATTQHHQCMWVKPKEIASDSRRGYEIAVGGGWGNLDPAAAMRSWQGSPLHNDVLTNRGYWTSPWTGVGCAISGGYGACWFTNQ